MDKKIYVIRHCEAEGQPPESPLTEKGYKQALELSEFLSEIKVDKVVTSPYLRAVQTIEPLAKKLKLEIELDSRLTERVLSQDNLPDWMEKLRATFTDLELKYEGGESSKEAMNRIVEA
ncbi:MAG: histidine phosphatase family protein, partial [Neobacillus sp.]|nr:histidine phosphatase family protein [Neobacillus sp.]